MVVCCLVLHGMSWSRVQPKANGLAPPRMCHMPRSALSMTSCHHCLCSSAELDAPLQRAEDGVVKCCSLCAGGLAAGQALLR